MSFGFKDIAEYYGTEDEHDHYDFDLHMKKKDDEDMKRRILTTLCREGASWVNDRASWPNKLKIVDFKPLAKVWHTFIVYTLLPTSNASEITVPRVILLYTIMTKGSIHIGKVIQK